MFDKIMKGIYIFIGIILVIVVIGAVGMLFDKEDDAAESDKPQKWSERDDDHEAANTKAEKSRNEEIEDTATALAIGYDNVSVDQISVNDDLGTGEGYIVLAYLSFDAKNRAKTTRDMIDRYTNDFGARLAKEEDVNEVTVFWEVPYLQDTGNVAKYNMRRQGDGMRIEKKHFDSNIFE